MTDFLSQAKVLFPYTQSLRRDFHMHPELGFRELRTGGIVAKELEALGIEVTKGVGKTGVVGLLEGSKPGPTLMLRFDMDALPITEETGAEYASQNNGVMHACGHDGHTAIGLTVAKILHTHREELNGTIKFCFQPSEEGPNGEETGGAETMMRDGLLDDPKVDMSLTLHLWNEKPLGWLGVKTWPHYGWRRHIYSPHYWQRRAWRHPRHGCGPDRCRREYRQCITNDCRAKRVSVGYGCGQCYEYPRWDGVQCDSARSQAGRHAPYIRYGCPAEDRGATRADRSRRGRRDGLPGSGGGQTHYTGIGQS
jgi:hypothetical protein